MTHPDTVQHTGPLAPVTRRGFTRTANDLLCQGFSLRQIAQDYGTPTYVYSGEALQANIQAFKSALAGHPHDIRYAVKANSAAGILQLVASAGLGADTVSGGEIARALRAGIDPKKIVFSGVGKTEREIRYALKKGIGCFNIESEAEFERINRIATELNVVVPFSIRTNPNVSAKTHPYISTGLQKNKFGIPSDQTEALYVRSLTLPHMRAVGIDAHIGSQILEARPHYDSATKMVELILKLQQQGVELEHIDIGGGYGIAYEPTDTNPPLEDFFQPIIGLLNANGLEHLRIMVEPGRAIVGNTGVLLARVEYLKNNGTKTFCITNTGMNDLIRPALYQAWMAIEVLESHPELPPLTLDVVGPVCESSDFLGLERSLAVKEGDTLVVYDAGAYGASMASRYNSRALPTELLIHEGKLHVLRALESFEAIIEGDRLIEFV